MRYHARKLWFLTLVALSFCVAPCRAQVFSEVPGNTCPTPQACPPADGSEVTCPVAHVKARQCAPSCAVAVCDGSSAANSFDVDGDCQVTQTDSDAVTAELNRRGAGSGRESLPWFDTNGDGSVDPRDVLGIVDLLNNHGCIPSPTPTSVPAVPPSCVCTFCDASTGSSSLDTNGDCQITAADAAYITAELNRRGSGRREGQDTWYDANRDGRVDPLDVLTVNQALSERGCLGTLTPTPTITPTATGTPTSTPTVTPTPVLLTCQISELIPLTVLTKIVNQGTLSATDSRLLSFPADARDFNISLQGVSIDDHSGRLDVNGVTVMNDAGQPSNLRGVNAAYSPPKPITSWRAGDNTLTATAGDNPAYQIGTGHIGATFCFTGTYRARVCNSDIGVERGPKPGFRGCGR